MYLLRRDALEGRGKIKFYTSFLDISIQVGIWNVGKYGERTANLKFQCPLSGCQRKYGENRCTIGIRWYEEGKTTHVLCFIVDCYFSFFSSFFLLMIKDT